MAKKQKVIGEDLSGTPRIDVTQFLAMAQKGRDEMANLGKSLYPQPAPASPGPPPAAPQIQQASSPQQNQIPVPLKPLFDKMDVISAKLDLETSAVVALCDTEARVESVLIAVLAELKSLNARFEA